MLINLTHLTELLALAAEIATTEQLPRPLSLKLAMQLWPTLDLDPDQSAGWPASMREEHRAPVPRRLREHRHRA